MSSYEGVEGEIHSTVDGFKHKFVMGIEFYTKKNIQATNCRTIQLLPQQSEAQTQ